MLHFQGLKPNASDNGVVAAKAATYKSSITLDVRLVDTVAGARCVLLGVGGASGMI